jgi:hypothetical protein
MAANLIDTAKSLITPDVASKVSFVIGETPAKTRQAIGTGVPPLAGKGCNEASTPGGASRLFSLINDTRLPGDLHSNLGGLLAGSSATDGLLKTGSGLISSLLGDKAAPSPILLPEVRGMSRGDRLAHFLRGRFQGRGSSGKQWLQRTSTASVDEGW